jgi:hypothetical protein
MRLLKQSTARSIAIFMTDLTDHISGKTGLTLTITASKDGAAFATITPTVTELANGWYKLALTTGHTDTLGDLALHITATGADPTDVPCQVVADLPGATVSSVSGAVGSVTGAVGSVTGNVGGNVVGTVASVVGNVGGNVVGSVASVTAGVTLAASAITAIWDKLTSALTTTGSIGKLLVDKIDATISSRAVAGDAMALTAGERTATAVVVESHLLDEGDGQMLINAIVGAIGNTNLDQTVLVAAVRADLERVGGALKTIQAKTDNLPANPASQTNLDVAVSSRLASAGYTAPDNSTIATINSKIGTPAATVSADIAAAHDAAVNSLQPELLRAQAFSFPFPMSAAGLTVTAQVSIDGTPWADTTNAPAEVGGKIYTLDLTADETDGKCILLKFSSVGNPDVMMELITQGAY